MMDSMLGPDFEGGLANLQRIAEEAAKQTPVAETAAAEVAEERVLEYHSVVHGYLVLERSMPTLAFLILQVVHGAGDTVPYTGPLSACVPRMVPVPRVEPIAGRQDRRNPPPACDGTAAAADPRCHLRTPQAPAETTLELLRIKPAARAAETRLVAPAPMLLGDADVSDAARDGFRRQVDRPPRSV